MLTDEELAELEAAIVAFDGPKRAPAALAISTMVEFTRDQIAREKAMRQPLTAEICERLELEGKITHFIYMDNLRIRMADNRLVIDMLFSEDQQEIENPTVSHLFAAAKLAGVELDWRKVGE